MMEKNYINPQIFNNGIHINGQVPLDDRVVLKSVEDLYIDESNPKDAFLFKRAYDGMPISVFEDANTISIYQLRDATPYTNGHVVTINAENLNDYWTVTNTKVIQDMITKATYYNGNGKALDLMLITDHGSLERGTTVEDLQKMTISDLLSKILFENAKPVCVNDSTKNTGSISFKSPFNATVEVGANVPTTASFNYSYTPEKWNWTSKADPTVSGEVVSLGKFSGITYYYNDTTNSTTGGTVVSASSTDKVVEGTKYYYGKIVYVENADAVDSLGNVVDDKTGEKYAAAQSGTVTTPTISYRGAWKIYSNATSYSSSASTIWSKRNDDIIASDYKGEDTKTDVGVFADGSKSVYLLFPKQTDDTQPFYVYVPASYKVTRIAGANNVVAPTSDDPSKGFDAVKTVGSPTTVNINNANNVTGSFKRYIIEKSAGNTAVMVTIAKA